MNRNHQLYSARRPSDRPRVAIFTESDYAWDFSTWSRTLPRLSRNFDITGIYLFPPRCGAHRGINATLWYLRTFGVKNFSLFAAHSVLALIRRMAAGPRTWSALAKAVGAEIHEAKSPNSPEVIRQVREEGVDILFISFDYIVKAPLLQAVRRGVINKHASMLPSCRGLFPYIWAKLSGEPTGFTFHVVDEQIDTGPILVQTELPDGEEVQPLSLLGFYIRVFEQFPRFAEIAAKRLMANEFTEPSRDLAPSYFSLPTRADVKRFEKQFAVARFADLFAPKGDSSVLQARPVIERAGRISRAG